MTYRNEDGSTGTMRMDSKPGSRISMGKDDVVKGYEVTYRYDGQEKTVRMDDKPNSDRLPVLEQYAGDYVYRDGAPFRLVLEGDALVQEAP